MNPHLKAFFEDKAAQKAWAEFVLDKLKREALKRVFAKQDTAALAEAHDIISESFKELDELFTPKKTPKPQDRAV